MDMPNDLKDLFKKLQEKKASQEVDEIPEGWFNAYDMANDTGASLTTVRAILQVGVDDGDLEKQKFTVIQDGRKSSRSYYHETNKGNRKKAKERKS